MALDRQSIEKNDFPVGRRGYDPDAVDAHLSAIAAEVAELQGQVSRGGDSVASAAADRVRAIIEAAEATSTQIRQEAEQQAHELRTQASSESKAARERANASAGEYVTAVAESMYALVGRIEEMSRELDAVVDSLRTGAGRVVANLEQLEQDLGVARQAAVSPEAGSESTRSAPPPVPKRPQAAAAPPPEDEIDADLALAQDAATELYVEPEAETASVAAPAAAPAASGEGASDEAASDERPSVANAEDARLIALNMALNGTPRGEVSAYLSENFDLPNQAALLDAVFASIEG